MEHVEVQRDLGEQAATDQGLDPVTALLCVGGGGGPAGGEPDRRVDAAQRAAGRAVADAQLEAGRLAAAQPGVLASGRRRAAQRQVDDDALVFVMPDDRGLSRLPGGRRRQQQP